MEIESININCTGLCDNYYTIGYISITRTLQSMSRLLNC